MSALHLVPGTKVRFRGGTFVIARVLDLESVLGKEIGTGNPQRLAIRELSPAAEPAEEEPRAEPDILSIPDADWQEANRRYEAIQPLLGSSQRTREEVVAQAALAGVHWTTIYAWIRKFESTERLSSLLPPKPSGGRGKSRLDPEVETVLQDVIERHYLRSQRPSVASTIEEVNRVCHNAGLPAPHENTVRLRIAVLTDEKKLARRHGARKAREKFELLHGEFPGADWPLSIVEIDHTKVDIMLVDEAERRPIGRPWLTLVIDVFSRMVLGFYVSLDPPGAIGTGLSLVHAILPKDQWLAKRSIEATWPSWGFPDVIHADNAKEFESKMLERACEDYGIRLEYRRVGRPQDGGHVERLLGTFAKEIHVLPGTTFSNSAQREDYDSEAKAVMTLAEFEVWLATLITGVYHQQKHSALGTSPLKRYEAGIFGTRQAPGRGLPSREIDEERLRLAFTPYVERTVQPYGVRIDGIHYKDDVLGQYVHARDPEHPNRKRKFRFRRDPRDISIVYFYDPDRQMHFPVRYRNLSLPPISLWELREATRFAREMGEAEIDERAIFAARNRLHEIQAASKQKTKKARRDAQRRKDHRSAERPLLAPGPRSPSSATHVAPTDEEGVTDDAELDEITPFDDMVQRAVEDTWKR